MTELPAIKDTSLALMTALDELNAVLAEQMDVLANPRPGSELADITARQEILGKIYRNHLASILEAQANGETMPADIHAALMARRELLATQMNATMTKLDANSRATRKMIAMIVDAVKRQAGETRGYGALAKQAQSAPIRPNQNRETVSFALDRAF